MKIISYFKKELTRIAFGFIVFIVTIGTIVMSGL